MIEFITYLLQFLQFYFIHVSTRFFHSQKDTPQEASGAIAVATPSVPMEVTGWNCNTSNDSFILLSNSN